MGAAESIDIELAILDAQIEGLDDAYTRQYLERIAFLAERAVHNLPDTHRARFLAILRQARV